MRRLTFVCCALVVGLTGTARAEEGVVSPSESSGINRPAALDLFAAADAGQVALQVIARDSRQCRVLVTNRTDRPLTLRWPDSVAAVPVLAQFGFPIGNEGGGNQAPQQLGLGQPQGNQPGLFFNVPPEKTLRLRVPAVCLDHGRPDPRPQMAYRLTTLEAIGAKPELVAVCRVLGTGKLSQKAAQAAAWHLRSGRNWDELAKQKIHSSFGPAFDQPFFTARELRDAQRAVTAAEKLVERGAKEPTAAVASVK